MSYSVVGPQEVTDARAWDAHVLSMPEPHILQSWAWGETKAQTGWRAKRLIWGEETPIPKIGDRFATWAAASVLFRRLNARAPVAVAYAPKGPLLDWSDEELRVRVLRDLEQEARKARALFVKVDPDVAADSAEGRELVDLLQRRGWTFSQEQIQYRNTMVSDLTPSEDDLLAAMKPKWRYNIRLAERKGVQVCEGGPNELAAFYAMYAETGARDGFLVRPFSYYQAIWARFLADGLAHLLLAQVDGKPVAGLILFSYGPTAWYFYGASTSEARDLMPNHALQWAAMQWAKNRGCSRYDWWGAPDELQESDPMWGVFRFKQGFGGEFVSHVGAWDFPVSKGLYWAYTRAMPRVLDVMRRRHRQLAPATE
jgi:lipid II:glycine glycyltransferase (peptidoglycan interpeptide bridge formation enzyme)